MSKQSKVYEVENLTESIKSAKSAAFIDYQGLDAAQNNELRQKIKKTGGSMQVAKNTLLKKALENVGIKLEKDIDGPTALVLAQEDQITPLKAVNDMAEELEKPKFKFGVLDGEFLPLEKIKKLVNLPDKKTLLSMLVNSLNSPLVNLVNALEFNQRKLVLVLKQVAKEKGGDK
jgi:large subunit ribosomal protein L10